MSEKNIISFSGGKDSTAMLLRMIELKENIHSVLYFDTEKEYPEIKEHIDKLKLNIPVRFVTVRHWLGFDYLKERYGEASIFGGWCTAAKRDTCNKYIRLIKKDYPNIIECIGFSKDEKKRAVKLLNNKAKKWKLRFPLIEWGFSENDSLEYCKTNGYDFNGIYDWMPNGRTGCYDCPKMSKKSKLIVQNKYPHLFKGGGK